MILLRFLFVLMVTLNKVAHGEEIDNEQHDFNNVTEDTNEVNDDFKYEINENFIDEPNNITKAPVIYNYTIKVPLNNATEELINNDKNFTLDLETPNKDAKFNARTKYISILHIKADFGDNREHFLKPIADSVNPVKVFGNAVNNIQGYLNGVKDGVSNVFNNNGQAGQNGDKVIYLPNVIAGPVLFLNKLQRRTADVAGRFRDAFFGK